MHIHDFYATCTDDVLWIDLIRASILGPNWSTLAATSSHASCLWARCNNSIQMLLIQTLFARIHLPKTNKLNQQHQKWTSLEPTKKLAKQPKRNGTSVLDFNQPITLSHPVTMVRTVSILLSYCIHSHLFFLLYAYYPCCCTALSPKTSILSYTESVMGIVMISSKSRKFASSSAFSFPSLLPCCC